MEVFAARKPVFDRSKVVSGYELAFRSDFDAYYNALDAETAAANFMAFVNFKELTDGKVGYVDFSRHLLMKGFPALLPQDKTACGVPASLEPDESVLAACEKLKRYGYTFAVNDFQMPHRHSPLVELADVIKVDLMNTSPHQQQEIAESFAGTGVRLLARHVSDEQLYTQARQWGYHLFQGEFFAKPVDKTNRHIPSNKLIHFRVMYEVSKPELSYDRVSDLIKQDVSMTYNLLRLVNSAWYGLQYKVESIRHALVLLGPPEIRRWVSLFVLRNTGADKPPELLVVSLTRAKACEQIGPLVGLERIASELFLLGMFSLIDALTDTPMDVVLEELPLSEDIKKVLLGGGGILRIIFDTVLAYERGDWDMFAQGAELLELDEHVVPDIFRGAHRWAKAALGVTEG
jgi:EAL and modified HD-GYP domain-containing signal transduction protein